MILIRNASLAFGSQKIFDDINLALSRGQRVGLVGRNGTGKSTLLKVIDNSVTLDNGDVSIEKDKLVAYMPQELVMNSQKSTFEEAFSVFDKFVNLEQEKNIIEKKLESSNLDDSPKKLDDIEKAIERHTEIIEELQKFDKSKSISRTQELLRGLGFKDQSFNKQVSSLSTGWKMRLLLAKLLLKNADFYLFDEPTNHLDIVTTEWFINFLKNSNFGFLLVSHDRYYLEQVCDHIFELEYSKGTLYKGNFSSYLESKEKRTEILKSKYENQQKEIAKKQALINRFRASATKASMAQSLIKKLDKIELIEVPPCLPTINLKFPEIKRSGKVALEFKNISYAFNNKAIFSSINGEIKRGDKVALIAANGMGKTTLLNIITGKYSIQNSNNLIKFGTNVKTAVFEQDQMKALDPNKSIFEEILNSCDSSESIIRSFLGSFLFSGDDINKKVSVLSGGERNRVATVKVLLQRANFLILDEPTNHLDLYSKDILVQALKQFDGTILFVSHDQDFLSKVATSILELTPQKLNSYPGSYDSYLANKSLVINQDNSVNISKNNNNTENIKNKVAIKSFNKNLKKEIRAVENSIEKLEKEISQLNNIFIKYSFKSSEYKEAAQKIKLVQKRLDAEISIWEELQSSYNN